MSTLLQKHSKTTAFRYNAFSVGSLDIYHLCVGMEKEVYMLFLIYITLAHWPWDSSVEDLSFLSALPVPWEACKLAGIQMLAVIQGGLQALQPCHVPWDDGTQWWLLLVSEQPRNGCLFNALWFNFLLFPAVRGGLVNLSYFFIMFVCSSVPVNEPPQSEGQGTGFTAPPPSTCGPLKKELVNGQSTIMQLKLTHLAAAEKETWTRHCCHLIPSGAGWR